MNTISKGMLIYDFHKHTTEKTINIGDYFQTLAALQLINENYKDKKIARINREDLKSLPNDFSSSDYEEIKFIGNGWYIHSENSFPLNKKYNPLFVSVHINEKMKLSEKEIESFKKFEPIGCRDKESVKKLESKGVKAYFSGCLTLTFKERNIKKRKGIIFIVDNLIVNIKGKKLRVRNMEQFKKWPGFKTVYETLRKNYTEDEIMKAKFYDQFSKLKLSIDKQFAIAEKRLNKLSKANLVVTTRIHSLMPSMSMGTPTLFIMKNNLDSRFEGLNQFWNYIDLTNVKKPVFNINYENKLIKNKNEFREFMKPTIKKVKDFWNFNE